MDKFFSLIQFIINTIISLCVVASVTAHIILRHITSIPGYLACLVFIALSYALMRISFKELRGNS